MAPRIRIGNLFGTKGIFVSKPGKDVTAPGNQLLMDTRFEYLEVHQAGRFDLDIYKSYSGDIATYATSWGRGSVTFPSLGYIPMVFVTPTMVNSGWVTDGNVGWYPVFSGYGNRPASIVGVTGSDRLGRHLYQSGYDVSLTTLTYEFSYAYGDGDDGRPDMKCDYIIFKNPAP